MLRAPNSWTSRILTAHLQPLASVHIAAPRFVISAKEDVPEHVSLSSVRAGFQQYLSRTHDVDALNRDNRSIPTNVKRAPLPRLTKFRVESMAVSKGSYDIDIPWRYQSQDVQHPQATGLTWVLPMPFCPIMVIKRVLSTICLTTCALHEGRNKCNRDY